MGIDYSTMIYLPNYEVWARSVSITPLASLGSTTPYANRGIFHTETLDVAAEDGSIFSTQKTTLDVREIEYAVLPAQGDRIFIPADSGAMVELGDFEVIDSYTNGGGETTLVLRSVTTAPASFANVGRNSNVQR